MLISIITVNFNDVQGLNTTMNSIFNQTYKDIEYIVIDGGSTDGSKELIEKHADKLSYWVSESDKGIYNAMNKGIKVANGEYFLFLNSGDSLYDNNSLSNFISLIGSDEYHFIYGNLFMCGDEKWIKSFPDNLSFFYFVNKSIPHPATLIKKECFDYALFDENLKIVSDWKLFVTLICKKNLNYKRIDLTLSKFNLDGISSTQSSLLKAERQQVLDEHFSNLMIDYQNFQSLRKELDSNKIRFNKVLKSIFRKVKNINKHI